MAEAVNMDYSRDILLRVSPQKQTFTVEEHKPGGIISRKEILPMDLYFAINASNEARNYMDSGFLPENCIGVSLCSTETIFYLWYPELSAFISYGDREYPNFPIPRMVFAVNLLSTGRVGNCSIGVVADEKPAPESLMYHYPFSNVYDNGHVCTGNNVLPRYKKQTAVANFPSYLLGIPDNDDYYCSSHNKLGLAHGELLEHLKDKDSAYYYTDILVPNGKTLNDFINRR